MYIKEKNEKDVRYILENLRYEDRLEAIAQKGEDYKQIILDEIMNAKTRTYLGCSEADDIPVGIGGFLIHKKTVLVLYGFYPLPKSKDIRHAY